MAQRHVGELKGSTLAGEVTARLRRAILSGEIPPGQRLRIGELVAQFGVSHIPIRESLRRLEGEGLVENKPRRGAVATRLSLDELAEVYDIRRLVEPQIAERAIEGYTAQHVELIRQSLEELEQVLDAPDSDAFVERHRGFHWLILEPGSSKLIRRVLMDQLWQISERYVRLALTVGHIAPTARAQHLHLYEACESQSRGQIRAEVIAHLNSTEDAVRAYFQSSPLEDDSTLEGSSETH